MKKDKLYQIRINWNLVVGACPPPLPCPILFFVIFDYWETWLKLVMLESLFLVVLDISGFIFRIILAIQYNYTFIDVLGLCLNLKW